MGFDHYIDRQCSSENGKSEDCLVTNLHNMLSSVVKESIKIFSRHNMEEAVENVNAFNLVQKLHTRFDSITE